MRTCSCVHALVATSSPPDDGDRLIVLSHNLHQQQQQGEGLGESHEGQPADLPLPTLQVGLRRAIYNTQYTCTVDIMGLVIRSFLCSVCRSSRGGNRRPWQPHQPTGRLLKVRSSLHLWRHACLSPPPNPHHPPLPLLPPALYGSFALCCSAEHSWRFIWPACISLLHHSLLPIAVLSFVGQVE